MRQENNSSSKNQILNTEKLQQLFNLYKFPILLGGIGVFLFVSAIILSVRTISPSSEVIFQTESSPSAKIKIRVDVAGAVAKPGVYTFVEGSRVEEAITAAGGLSSEADKNWVEKNLNKAAKLIDGGKIYIPSLGEGKTQNSKLKTQNLVNINSAIQAELETLPGVGPVTAGRIIAARPYQTIEELKTRKIIGNALFEKIKELLTL